MTRPGRFDRGLLLLILIVVILAATGIFLYEQIRTDKAAETLKIGGPLKVSFLISDKDTLLFTEVFVLNPTTNRGALFDIPGNVGSLIESLKRIDRIDVLYKRSNPQAFQAKTADLLGTTIPFSIQIDIRDVPKLVDLLGGLNLFIADPVEQTDKDPPVLLPSGNQLLDGSKVQSYLTYKDPNDTDIEIVNREQRFVQGLLKAIGENAKMLSAPQARLYLEAFLSTNMNRRSLLTFVNALSKLDTDRMVFQRVLGVKRTVDNQVLLFPHYDGKLLQETWSQTLDTLASAESSPTEAAAPRIQILNGTLLAGLARRTAEIFDSFGFDVVAVGNADRQDYDNTVVIDRKGDATQAQRAADVIKCTRVESGPPRADQEGSSTDNYDVTIILGKDFDGRYCK